MEEYWQKVLDKKRQGQEKKGAVRLTWGGNIAAQNEADEAYAKMKASAGKSRRKKKGKKHKQANRALLADFAKRLKAGDKTLKEWQLERLKSVYSNDKDAKLRDVAVLAGKALAELRQRPKVKRKITWRLKGGRVNYKLYIESPEWQEKRQQAFRRHGKMCQRCKSLIATEVHHLTYVRLGGERLTDLQVVCKGCHENIHESKYGNAANIDKRFADLVKSF